MSKLGADSYLIYSLTLILPVFLTIVFIAAQGGSRDHVYFRTDYADWNFTACHQLIFIFKMLLRKLKILLKNLKLIQQAAIFFLFFFFFKDMKSAPCKCFASDCFSLSCPVSTPTKTTAATSLLPKPCWTRKSRTGGCRISCSAVWSHPSAGSWTSGASLTSLVHVWWNTRCCCERSSDTLLPITQTWPVWRQQYVTCVPHNLAMCMFVANKIHHHFMITFYYTDHYNPGDPVWYQREKGGVWVPVLHWQTGVSGR